MKTIPEVSALLAARVKNLRKGKMALCDEAGITARTLRNVLSGSEDYKVSTLRPVWARERPSAVVPMLLCIIWRYTSDLYPL